MICLQALSRYYYYLRNVKWIYRQRQPCKNDLRIWNFFTLGYAGYSSEQEQNNNVEGKSIGDQSNIAFTKVMTSSRKENQKNLNGEFWKPDHLTSYSSVKGSVGKARVGCLMSFLWCCQMTECQRCTTFLRMLYWKSQSTIPSKCC